MQEIVVNQHSNRVRLSRIRYISQIGVAYLNRGVAPPCDLHVPDFYIHATVDSNAKLAVLLLSEVWAKKPEARDASPLAIEFLGYATDIEEMALSMPVVKCRPQRMRSPSRFW